MENPLLHLTLAFSKNFPQMNLDMVSKREPRSFEKEFVELEKNYSSFGSTVNEFRQKINWGVIARQHYLVYINIKEKQKTTEKIPGEWLIQIQGGGHGVMPPYPETAGIVIEAFHLQTYSICKFNLLSIMLFNGFILLFNLQFVW
jgi:hypothetical protein